MKATALVIEQIKIKRKKRKEFHYYCYTVKLKNKWHIKFPLKQE